MGDLWGEYGDTRRRDEPNAMRAQMYIQTTAMTMGGR